MIRLAAVLIATGLAASACSTRQAPPPMAMTSGGPDTCGASGLQAAVNQPASILPTNLTALRIVDVKQSAPAYDAPARLTVINDIQEQKVREIRCG